MKVPTRSIIAATYLGCFCYNPEKTWKFTVRTVAGVLFFSVVGSMIFPSEKSIDIGKPEKRETGTQTDEEFPLEDELE